MELRRRKADEASQRSTSPNVKARVPYFFPATGFPTPPANSGLSRPGLQVPVRAHPPPGLQQLVLPLPSLNVSHVSVYESTGQEHPRGTPHPHRNRLLNGQHRVLTSRRPKSHPTGTRVFVLAKGQKPDAWRSNAIMLHAWHQRERSCEGVHLTVAVAPRKALALEALPRSNNDKRDLGQAGLARASPGGGRRGWRHEV